jgi:hypothetical protein
MASSISYLMHYSRRGRDTNDWTGGVPAHLPYYWPRCQACQERMAFVGQLYSKEWFPIDGHLALQFYVCDDCQETRKWVHMEALPGSASANTRAIGVRCRSQPRLYIDYVQIEDSMDQWTFGRRHLAETELQDKHLRKDKIGGLFPYDGYDGPKITKQNRMIAQFIWQGIGSAMYLYQSAEQGIYPYLYH